MDRNKTKKALQDAMKKLGNAPRRKVSGMSPGKRKAITGSATGKTAREKLMAAFKTAKAKRKTGEPAAKRNKLMGMTPEQFKRRMGPRAGAGPMAARSLAGAMPGLSGVMNKSALTLAKKIAGNKRPSTADVKRATAMLKKAMKGASKGK
jgi:hypothetical protein